jgi:serine/threonine protein kinase
VTSYEHFCLFALGKDEYYGSDWDIRAQDPWIHVTHRRIEHLPRQGWKLHISASLGNAEQVLTRVLAVLKEHPCHFKLALSETILRSLNMGSLGHSQVGKFITIYPKHDRAAVQIANLIDTACPALQGPRIPSDHRLRSNSIVYYRYGSFEPFQARSPLGEYVRMMQNVEGILIPDEVTLWPITPASVINPFVSSTEPDPANEEKGEPIPDRFGSYVPIKALLTSPKGSVFLAIDTGRLRRCIVKQANRHIPVGFQFDAVDYLRREAETLRNLDRSGVSPRFYDFVDTPDYSYLVMEDIPDQTMEEICNIDAPSPTNGNNRWPIATALCDAVATVHSCGYVHGDLKTANILVSEDLHVKLIDFELAVPIGSARSDNRGTHGYMRRTHSAAAATSDDIYAMGAVFLYLATGNEPSTTVFSNLLDDPRFDPSMAAVPDLLAVGKACLREEFATTSEVSTALQRARSAATVQAPVKGFFLGDESCDEQDISLAVSRVASVLCRTATELLGRHSSYAINTDLNDGLSGLLIGLLLVPEGTNERAPAHDLALRVADFLITKLTPPGIALPGLFVGDMGAAVALTVAGRALKNDRLISAARQLAARSIAANLANPDLFHGMAGRLMGLLCLGEQHDCREYRQLAAEEWIRLSAASVREENESVWFEIPSGYSGLSNKRFLGAAHGCSGVGISVARGIMWGVIDSATSRVRKIRDAVLRAKIEQRGGGLGWPVESGQEEVAGPFWCHGVGGIAQFLIETNVALGSKEEVESIERCIESLGTSGWCYGLDLCHGSAGSVETLALARDYGYLNSDRAMAAYNRCCNVFVRQVNASGDQDGLEFREQYGLMVGYAGILYALRRISARHRVSALWSYLAGRPSEAPPHAWDRLVGTDGDRSQWQTIS